MRRTTVTIPAELDSLLAESAAESMLRRALEEWLAEHGESSSVLRSEGGRIRVMLQVAAETLKERALDISYRQMAVSWQETDHGRREARDRAIRVEVLRWDAEELEAHRSAADAEVSGG